MLFDITDFAQKCLIDITNLSFKSGYQYMLTDL